MTEGEKKIKKKKNKTQTIYFTHLIVNIYIEVEKCDDYDGFEYWV